MEGAVLDMHKYFEDRMAKFEAELLKKPSTITGSLAEDFAAFKSFVLESLRSFSQQLETVAREVDNLEMRSRRKILLLHGVEEMKGEETVDLVVEVVKQRLRIESFSTSDVKRCHRMGRQTSTDKPRPIVVKFESVTVRDSVWFSKTKLKGTGVTLSEFLTRSRHNAFMAARAKFGVAKCWTREGCVYVLGADGTRHRVSSVGDLENVKCSEPEKTATKTTTAKGRRAVAAKK